MSRLIMVHGQYPGVGQSTLTRCLAEALPDADVLWEDELSQPAIFTRPEFARVAERFHRHNSDPGAGIGHPPASLLEEAYAALVSTAVTHGRTVLMGWSVMDLAEDLDWARADESALGGHAAATRVIFEPLDPVLVQIRGDLEKAMGRAILQRGREWFTGRKHLPPSDWDSVREMFLLEMKEASNRIERALGRGGWLPGFQVDGTRLSAPEVLTATVDHLVERGIDFPGGGRLPLDEPAQRSPHS